MPTPNQETRQLFRDLLHSLLKAIMEISDMELALRKKGQLSPDEETNLNKLFRQRVSLQNAMIKVRRAEIRFLASPLILADANRALQDAASIAQQQVQNMADLLAALQGADMIVKLIVKLVAILG